MAWLKFVARFLFYSLLQYIQVTIREFTYYLISKSALGAAILRLV
jgi:hypothetical protein